MKVYEVRFSGKNHSHSVGIFSTLARAQKQLEESKNKVLLNLNSHCVWEITPNSFSYSFGWVEDSCKYAIQELDVIE